MVLALKLIIYCFLSICVSNTLSNDISTQYMIIYFCMVGFLSVETYKKYNGGTLND